MEQKTFIMIVTPNGVPMPAVLAAYIETCETKEQAFQKVERKYQRGQTITLTIIASGSTETLIAHLQKGIEQKPPMVLIQPPEEKKADYEQLTRLILDNRGMEFIQLIYEQYYQTSRAVRPPGEHGR